MDSNYYGQRQYGESENDFLLRRLRNFGYAAYKFLNECDGHRGILLNGDVELHISVMWSLWNLLGGTWNESYRFTRDYLKKMCEDMRNKPIRTKGKIFPFKSGNSLCDQMTRIRALAFPFIYGKEMNPHYKRALEIEKRYGKNISETKEWKDAFQKAYDWAMRDITHIGFSDTEAKARTAGFAAAYCVKLPREVYAA